MLVTGRHRERRTPAVGHRRGLSHAEGHRHHRDSPPQRRDDGQAAGKNVETPRRKVTGTFSWGPGMSRNTALKTESVDHLEKTDICYYKAVSEQFVATYAKETRDRLKPTTTLSAEFHVQILDA